MKIFCKFPTINIYKYIFLISNMHWELNLDNFKGDFLSNSIFLHPQNPDFQIIVYRPNIVRL